MFSPLQLFASHHSSLEVFWTEMTLKEGQAACGGGAESMGLLGRLDLSHALDERSRSALAPSPFYSPPQSVTHPRNL